MAVVERMAKGVGAALQRKEDKRHLLGRGQFTSDLRFPGLRDVAFLRSPIAHGHIRRIDIPEDIRSQVVLASDLKGAQPIRAVTDAPGFKAADYPLLAFDKVLFVGQPIALCIGRTRAEAEDVAQQIDIEFEELPAVVDMQKALESAAPLLHESWEDNVYLTRDYEAGDLEQARQQAAVVVERE